MQAMPLSAPSLQSVLLSCVGCFVCGVLDSLRLHQTAVFFLASNLLRVRFVQCLVLNGGIFLSSVLVAEHVLAPLLNLMLAVGGGGSAFSRGGSSGALSANSSSGSGGSSGLAVVSSSLVASVLPALPAGLSSALLYLYYLVWVYPLYCISFILNSIWYQSIAEEAFSASGLQQPTAPASFRRWLRLMSEELYRLLLISCFVLQMAACSLLPIVGQPLAFAHLCWLQALYSFDYHWSLQGWTLEWRLEYFERRFSYFAGFGLPAAALTVAAPRLIASGLFAIAFPMLIILAVIAQPLPLPPTTASCSSSSSSPPFLLSYAFYRSLAAAPLPRLPVFHYAKLANNGLLNCLRHRQLRAVQQQQQHKQTAAAAQQTARRSLSAALEQQRSDDSGALDR